MSALADGRSWPKGFSITTRRHWRSFSVTRPGSAEAGDRRGKETIRDGKVEEVVARGVGGLLQSGQVFAQPPVSSRIVEVALHIAHAVAEPSPRVLIQLVDLKLAAAGDEAPSSFR